MIKSKQIEIEAASSFGLTINAMNILATPTSDPYGWKQSLESCTRQELQLLQDFLELRTKQGYQGYKSKIKNIRSRLGSVSCL